MQCNVIQPVFASTYQYFCLKEMNVVGTKSAYVYVYEYIYEPINLRFLRILPHLNSLTFKSLAVSLRTTRVNIQNSTWCSLCVECFVWISEQTATFAVYSIN